MLREVVPRSFDSDRTSNNDCRPPPRQIARRVAALVGFISVGLDWMDSEVGSSVWTRLFVSCIVLYSSTSSI